MKEMKIETLKQCIEIIEDYMRSHYQSGGCLHDIKMERVLKFLYGLNYEPSYSLRTPAGQADQMIKMLKTHGFNNDGIVEILKGSISLCFL